MGPFLLFVFVLASQVIGGMNTKLPPPVYGDTITILSIDGGGIKGIIPSIVLENLEIALKIVAKDENAALADYFDVIAGSSTGGIIAAMLASPRLNDPTRPALTAPEVLQFYLEYGPSIFNESEARDWNEDTPHSKFSGKVLHEKARELLQETRLHDTLTNVVLPTFDIFRVHPLIFSSLKLDKIPSLDVKMSDIVIATSAAPSQLPPHYFKEGDVEFNLVDGAIAASNPALLAVSEVIQALNEKNSNFIPLKENKPKKIVLLSLGCGNSPLEGVPVSIAQNFSLNTWAKLLVPGLADSAGDVNLYHLESVFPSKISYSSSDNYHLRIDEYNLDPLAGKDASDESMNKLIEAGKNLLKENVKIMEVNAFFPVENPFEGTNSDALQRLAGVLYKEKELRLKRKASMEKRGRPFMEDVTFPLRTNV